MVHRLAALWSDDSGQGLEEYALILALLSLGLLLVLILFRDSIGDVFHRIGQLLQTEGYTGETPVDPGSGG